MSNLQSLTPVQMLYNAFIDTLKSRTLNSFESMQLFEALQQCLKLEKEGHIHTQDYVQALESDCRRLKELSTKQSDTIENCIKTIEKLQALCCELGEIGMRLTKKNPDF